MAGKRAKKKTPEPVEYRATGSAEISIEERRAQMAALDDDQSKEKAS